MSFLTREEYEARGVAILVDKYRYSEKEACEEFSSVIDAFLEDEGIEWGCPDYDWLTPESLIDDVIVPHLEYEGI